jgi:hypothetical protein
MRQENIDNYICKFFHEEEWYVCEHNGFGNFTIKKNGEIVDSGTTDCKKDLIDKFKKDKKDKKDKENKK